jgi:hypothetical protein
VRLLAVFNQNTKTSFDNNKCSVLFRKRKEKKRNINQMTWFMKFSRQALLCSIADSLCSIILIRFGDNCSCDSALMPKRKIKKKIIIFLSDFKKKKERERKKRTDQWSNSEKNIWELGIGERMFDSNDLGSAPIG